MFLFTIKAEHSLPELGGMRFKAPPHNSCEQIDHMCDLIERLQIYQADYIGVNAFNDIAVEKYSVITFDWWSGIHPSVRPSR